MTVLTTAQLDAKRRELGRLQSEITDAEMAIKTEEVRRAALSPQQRLAEALHEMFPSYRGAGGAMDGGDPWYYENDPNCSPTDPWKGSEHVYFLDMAEEIANRWYPDAGAFDDVRERIDDLIELGRSSLSRPRIPKALQ